MPDYPGFMRTYFDPDKTNPGNRDKKLYLYLLCGCGQFCFNMTSVIQFESWILK